MTLARYFPILDWSRHYGSVTLTRDLTAAVIVTIMLIPQSLAYAMLAGLPPQVGLYASIGPLLAYTLLGSSRTLSVGPVAVVSLMTAASISQIAIPGSPQYIGAAMALSLLSGLFLFAMGLFRLGFLANFLSHPVISGFITASGILIATSQLKHIFGVTARGHTLPDLVVSLAQSIAEFDRTTLVLGLSVIAFLFFSRSAMKPLLESFGLRQQLVNGMTKVGPVIAVIVSTLIVATFSLDETGVRVVGEVPMGLPSIAFPDFDRSLWQQLLPAAVLISVIGFVESVSVGQTLAAKRRQRIDPDQELIGLGAANVASAISGGYPVTGGFSRSVVNFDAGAETPMSGAMTAGGIALTALFFYAAI